VWVVGWQFELRAASEGVCAGVALCAAYLESEPWHSAVVQAEAWQLSQVLAEQSVQSLMGARCIFLLALIAGVDTCGVIWEGKAGKMKDELVCM
jgi:hypothetical protein